MGTTGKIASSIYLLLEYNMNTIDYEYSQYLLRYGKFITDDFVGNARIRIIRAPFSGLWYHKMVNGEVVKLVNLTSAE